MIEWLAPLALFAFVSSITPGPNNLMLMASGANFGFARTLPHMLGVGLGFMLMIVLVGLGIIGLLNQFPLAYDLLLWACTLYLFFLAYKIATSTSIEGGTESSGKPFSFLQAALFQWVNPKAWTMALTGVTVYAPTQSVESVFAVAIIFGLINLPSVSSWVVLGQQIRRFLGTAMRLKLFNYLMAVLLLASVLPTLA